MLCVNLEHKDLSVKLKTRTAGEPRLNMLCPRLAGQIRYTCATETWFTYLETLGEMLR